MIKANFSAYDTYVVDSLYQWDINQTLEVKGLNLTTAPEVHFSNANTDRAIVKQSSMSNRVMSVLIPNSLLQEAFTIHAHIGIYEGDTFKVVEHVEIPIIPRKRPLDYQIEDSDGELYSFKALENALENRATKAEAAALGARVDNIIANASDTGDNAELIDMRTDIGGTVHPSAGAAVRAQNTYIIARLKDMSYYTDILMNSGVLVPDLSFENKVFSSSNGALSDSDIRAITSPIYIPYGARAEATANEGYSISNVGNYDIYGNYLGSGEEITGLIFRRYVVRKSDDSPITPAEAAEGITVRITYPRTVSDNVMNVLAENFAHVKKGKNLLDRRISTLGYISDAYGRIKTPSGTSYYTSNYIPINSGESVVISPRIRKFLAFDAAFQPIATSYMDAELPNYVYTAAQSGYFRITYYGEDDVQIEYGEEPTAYESYAPTLDSAVKLSQSHLSSSLCGKVGLSFGDSIMYGSGNGGVGILDILGEQHGVIVNDYSVGGASVEKISGRNFIGDQIDDAAANGEAPDFILLDGLSNDIVHGTLGEMSDSFDYENNGYATFAAGLEYCIGKIKAAFPNVPLVYVIPHSSAGRDYAAELAFGDMARAICRKWSVPVADIYSDGNMTARLDAQLQAYTYYPTETTGTHPNRAGYEKAYIPIIAATLTKVLN